MVLVFSAIQLLDQMFDIVFYYSNKITNTQLTLTHKTKD